MERATIDLAWAAGFFDGEGSITICKRADDRWGEQYSLQICAGQDHLSPLLKFQEMFDGYIWSTKDKTHFQWRSNAQIASLALQRMFPYLRVKHEQAEIGIQFQAEKLAKGQRFRDEQHRQMQMEANEKAYLVCRELKSRKYHDAVGIAVVGASLYAKSLRTV